MKKILVIAALLLLIVPIVSPQTIQISGTVTGSEDGKVIVGVSVQVKGTTTGALTGADGKYNIPLTANSQALIFSYIGFKTQEVAINGKTQIDVVLEQDIYKVDEIVVVGYGTQKKKEVTGSISAVKGDDLKSFATPSFETQLAGRSAGLNIFKPTGILGEAPIIRIRGEASIFKDNIPLIVVDGIPVITGNQGGYTPSNALGDINPADIESIEVLKDGSATAIYGSRAASGIILITTKRGKITSSKIKMNYNNYFGFASPVKFYDLLKADDFVTINNEKRSNAGMSAIAFSDGAAHPGEIYETDWQKAVLRTNAFQQDHALSLSGATPLSSYFFSAGFTDQEGVAIPNKMRRFTGRSNMDQKVTKWLTIGSNIGVTHTEYNGLLTGSNYISSSIFSATRQHPNVPIYDPADPTGYNIDDINPGVVGRWNNTDLVGLNLPNIVYVIDNNVFYTRVLRVMGNLYAQVQIIPELMFKTQISIDGSKTDGFFYSNPTHGDGMGSNGIEENSFSNNQRWNFQNILTYTDTFSDIHNLTVTAVYETQFTRSKSFWAHGSDLSNDFFNHTIITGTLGTMSVGGGLSESGFISYAGRINYNFREKYFIQGSLRYDGISSLPEINKWGLFPGGSLGWTITKEPFMSGTKKILSDLKLRVSYAQVGNVNIGDYPYLGLYGAAKYADSNGIAFSQIGNDQLQWETSKKFDAGFDASLCNGKYKLTFDYYLNNQDGIILGVPLPLSFGVPSSTINENVGALRNIGYEFSADAFIFRKKDFTWQIDANITFSQNEVLSLVGDKDMVSGPNIVRVGESLYSIYSLKYWGVNPANGNPVYYRADGTLVQGNIPNSTYYAFDPANPGDISTPSTFSIATERFVIGPLMPTFFGGINTTMRYKGLDLNLMFRYSGGNYIMNTSRLDHLSMSFVNNDREILGRWQSTENPGDGWTPRLWYGNSFMNPLSTRVVEKGNFIKLQNIVLGYNFPGRLISRIGIESLRIFAQGQELFTFTKYTGIDPEMGLFGYDYNWTPRQRIFTIGINLTL
jgi:TonB-dependent starch-binding outer membrane protein SusC